VVESLLLNIHAGSCFFGRVGNKKKSNVIGLLFFSLYFTRCFANALSRATEDRSRLRFIVSCAHCVHDSFS